MNQLNLFQTGTPIEFKRTDNGYKTEDGERVTVEQLMEHSHLIVNDNGIIWVEQ